MRVTPLTRRLGSTAVVAVLALGITACGEDDAAKEGSAGSGDSTSQEAGSETEEVELEELAGDQFYTEVYKALQEAETFDFTSTTTSAGQTQEVSGEARYDGKSMEMKAATTGAQAMEMIMDDNIMYMRSDQLDGDKWIKIDLGADKDSLLAMMSRAADPEVSLKAMQDPKAFELVGTEEINGVETNHYKITIDPKSYLKALEFPPEFAESLPKDLVTEMWVDAENRPIKFTQTTTTAGVNGGAAQESTTEGTYSDFGGEVEIDAPADSEISKKAIPGLS